jgi:hypothetical protein
MSDDGAVEDVEGGEQRGCAVTFVVMRHGVGAARLHRQSWLGAVERLDLALFFDRENDRMGGRVDVEADNVLEFLRELRVVRQLERPDAMRGELVSLKDALHRSQAHACRLLLPAAGTAPTAEDLKDRRGAETVHLCKTRTGIWTSRHLRIMQMEMWDTEWQHPANW